MDKAALLSGRAHGVETVALPGDLGEIRVRPLTRAEALDFQAGEMDAGLMERKLLALALVDPQLTEAEVGQWQDVSPAGEMQPVVEAALRLAGLMKGADRQAYEDFRGRLDG